MSSVTPTASPPVLAAQLAKNLSETRRRIETAALRYRRDPRSISLLAVSKQQPAEAIRAAADLGQRDFGENYLQEAIPKIGALCDARLTWHFIGQVQSNKTKTIAELFQWVHTVDRLKLAERLNEQRAETLGRLNICIQVKLAEEVGKGGVGPNEAIALARDIVAMPRLHLRGIMCIPPPKETFDEQLLFFRDAQSLFHRLRADGLDLDTLSMGMSADLEAAIASDATIVRVGTAIFGERRDT
jgi:PLP dependent protein